MVILFQFLYGSIGRMQQQFQLLLKRCFNSFMVRLEGERNYRENLGLREFQFLYGSIGSMVIEDDITQDAMFQFLYGSIGSC